MNCEKCQEQLSDFLDGALSDAESASFSIHLEECLECFNVHAELDSIVVFCRDTRGEYDAPPNEHALWLRIRNTIESQPLAQAAARNSTRTAQRESWFKHALGRSWQLSFGQMVTAVVGIIIFASLATVVSLRTLKSGNPGAATEQYATGGNGTVALMGPKDGAKNSEASDIWQQQQIKYLIQVVDQHKVHWNPQVRADFERNLTLLDETVNESMRRLSAHPHDEVTEEMLNSALNDKMQLLQEFSDL